MITIVDVAVEPAARKMLDGENMITGPPTIVGIMEPVRETVPLNPPML